MRIRTARFTTWNLSRHTLPDKKAVGICGREALWFYSYYDMLEVHNGLLYVAESKREVKTSTVLRLVAPLTIGRQIFKQIHQSRMGGHQGINNTIFSGQACTRMLGGCASSTRGSRGPSRVNRDEGPNWCKTSLGCRWRGWPWI